MLENENLDPRSKVHAILYFPPGSSPVHIRDHLRFGIICGAVQDRSNLFVKWMVRYIEDLDITNLRGKDQNVRYTEVIVID